MLDIYKVKTRLEEIHKRVSILKKDFQSLPERELVSNENLYAAAERHLEVAIQACLDIANHIVAALCLSRPSREAAEVFSVLASEGILDKELAETMRESAGYRNILVHEYVSIQRSKTYENIQQGLGDLVEFAKQIERFLEHFQKSRSFTP